MPRTLYVLRIERPEEIDTVTLAEIEGGAAAQDATFDAMVARWLCGYMEDAESAISVVLPEGWYAAIEEAGE